MQEKTFHSILSELKVSLCSDRFFVLGKKTDVIFNSTFSFDKKDLSFQFHQGLLACAWREAHYFYFIFSSINVMKQLIGSSNLFVMQVEMDVYTALKKVLP